MDGCIRLNTLERRSASASTTAPIVGVCRALLAAGALVPGDFIASEAKVQSLRDAFSLSPR